MTHKSIYRPAKGSVIQCMSISKECNCLIGRDHEASEKYDPSKDRIHQLEQLIRKQDSKIAELTNMLEQVLDKK